MKSNYLSDFIIQKQSQGQYSFSLQELKTAFTVSDSALHQSLKRLVRKGKICSVRRNFYVIIPPEYGSQGILPPALFINDLMKWTGKPYYVGLISAAVFHGSSHQQPQEFFVITVKPSMRRISVRGLNINFIIRKKEHCLILLKRHMCMEIFFLIRLPAVNCVKYYFLHRKRIQRAG